jgi:hypothetical protein
MHISFNDLDAENTDDARDAVKLAMVEMQADCHNQIAEALESVGARAVKIDMVVY